MEHYNKIIIDKPFKNPGVIPDSWYRFSRQDVDASVRKASLKAGFDKWVTWEKETKDMYSQYHKELLALNEIAAAMELKKYIIDVDKELAIAEQKELSLNMIDYDMDVILAEQKEVCKKYKKKLKEEF